MIEEKKKGAVGEAIDIIKKEGLGRLFVGDTDNTLIQFFRYCFVGGFATIVDWGTSFIMFHWIFGNHLAVLANSLSFVFGLIVNYILSTFWIFKSSKTSNKFLEFLGFAAIGVVGLLMTMLITWLFKIWLSTALPSAYQILGKIVSTAVSFLWNFFARKYLLFGSKETKESN